VRTDSSATGDEPLPESEVTSPADSEMSGCEQPVTEHLIPEQTAVEQPDSEKTVAEETDTGQPAATGAARPPPASPAAATSDTEGTQAAAKHSVVASAAVADAAISVPLADEAGGTHGLTRTRREWLLLGERVFSHPRYAVLIVVALGLCAFEHYAVLLASLAVFFTVELGLRFWLQRERQFANRAELGFLLLDAIATLSLLFAVMQPAGVLAGGMYLRLARLLRGMYMLRMLRIFRFLTYETLIYSMPYAMGVLTLAALAVLMPDIALFAGMVLILEAACRGVALIHTLEDGTRRRAELGFAGLDLLTSCALLGVLPVLSPGWALLRAVRFLVMLNPMGNLWAALLKVGSLDEVRKELAMLAGVFVLLMALTAVAVLYLYPGMDLSGDDVNNAADYAPWQVILYSFRFLLDPGNAPADAFSPMLALVTMGIVLSGVFFFALFVGLGSNVMHFLLEQLANSPLSARESLLVAGWSKQAMPVLRVFDQMCARMRRSFASAWIFFGPVGSGARSIGRWLAVRQAERGERGLMRRFRLSGVRFSFVFQSRYSGWQDRTSIADMHALIRDGALPEAEDSPGVVVCDAALPEDILGVYRDSLGMDVLDSASLKARMLYQMHHCVHMPELGARMLDVVNGEPGLYAVAWDVTVHGDASGPMLEHDGQRVPLEYWLTRCFEQGINLLAGRSEDGEFRLFGDMGDFAEGLRLTDVVGIGRDPLLWPSAMRHAMGAGEAAVRQGKPALKDFNWPETWDINIIFMGWHDGLPAMMEEMAERHHKLAVHVLFPGDENSLRLREQRMQAAAERAAARTGCELEANVLPWYGFSAEVLMPYLKGCKVIMLYPEDAAGGEDSLLEMWFHEVARMLDARKSRVKWWTPPKLMVLPRDAANVPSLRSAARRYSRLDIDVGSPDSFHDVFMARQLLSRVLHHARPEHLRQDTVAYDFMQVVLGDAVIIEDVAVQRLFADGAPSWSQVYREAWKRGWMLTAYLLPDAEPGRRDMFSILDAIFPLGGHESGSRMHLMGGSPAEAMDAPLHASSLLFCRRGVLRDKADEQVAPPVPVAIPAVQPVAKDSPVSADKQEDGGVPPAELPASGTDIAPVYETPPQQEEPESPLHEDAHVETEVAVEDTMETAAEEMDAGRLQEESPPEDHLIEEGLPTEIAKEGEVMQSSVWPESADKRLLMVLKKQVEGALALLNASTEDGLIKLTDAMDRDVEGILADDIMAALTDFQAIDRVMQRLKNVETCLNDWGQAATAAKEGQPLWKNEVEKRYVMEEERQVLRSEL